MKSDLFESDTSLSPSEQRKQFFSALYEYCDHKIELRAFSPNRRVFAENAQDKKIETFISQNIGQDLYFGIATRDGKGGTKENTKEVPGFWMDIDFKDFKGGEEEAKEVLQNILHESSPAVCNYPIWEWMAPLLDILKEPEEANEEDIEPYLKGLAKRFKGDLASAELQEC